MSDVEELGHHLANATEIHGAMLALEQAVQQRQIEGDGRWIDGEHSIGRWSKHPIHARGLAFFQIRIDGPGVAGEIFPSAKLRGIDENGNRYGLSLLLP